MPISKQDVLDTINNSVRRGLIDRLISVIDGRLSKRESLAMDIFDKNDNHVGTKRLPEKGDYVRICFSEKLNDAERKEIFDAYSLGWNENVEVHSKEPEPGFTSVLTVVKLFF